MRRDSASFRLLVRTVATETQTSPELTRRVVDVFLAVVRDTVWQQGRVEVPELGVFSVRKQKMRVVQDPAGRPLAHLVPERKVIGFRASKNWRSDG